MRLALGRASVNRSSAPSRSSAIFRGEGSVTASPRALVPGLDRVAQRTVPTFARREALAQQHEIDLAIVLAACIERGEARARLGHHVQREPRARVFLVAVPRVELGLAQLLERLGRAVGEREQQLRAERLDAL